MATSCKQTGMCSSDTLCWSSHTAASQKMYFCVTRHSGRLRHLFSIINHPICNSWVNRIQSTERKEHLITKHFISILQRSSILLQCILGGTGHILLALRGRHPLCGTGVLSVIDTTSRPAIVSPLIADCATEKYISSSTKLVIKTMVIMKRLRWLTGLVSYSSDWVTLLCVTQHRATFSSKYW